MRVITGTARGATLFTLDGNEMRPTSQRVKEAVFSAVQFHIPGAEVLDLFAGTGQMGIEALSRGAKEAVFVDASEDCIKLIRKNLNKTGLYDKSRVVKSDVFRFMAAADREYDIVFIDPPYKLNLAAKIVRRTEPHVSEDGFLICETEPGIKMAETVGQLTLLKQYKHGQTLIWLYRKTQKAEQK